MNNIKIEIFDKSNTKKELNKLHPIENDKVDRVSFVVNEKIKLNKVQNTKPFSMSNILKRDEYIKIYGNKFTRDKKEIEKKFTILQSSLSISSLNEKIDSNNNGFISSALRAYSGHHELVLRPDDIWFAIVNQFSIYVNKYSMDLSSKFVDFQGKRELVIKTLFPILSAPFDEMTIEMTKIIQENIIDPSIKDWIVPNFTTTTVNDKVVFSVALMSTMKSYFNYVFQTECGIPKITLLGTLDDWVSVKKRIQMLKEFDLPNTPKIKISMSQWIDDLYPIIDNFIHSKMGNINQKWWNQIIRYDEESGGNFISGWITVFCLFDKDNEWITRYQNCDFSMFDQERKMVYHKIDYDLVSKGYLSVPIILREAGNEYKTEMYAGHLTSSVKNSSTIIPSLDWCLVLLNE